MVFGSICMRTGYGVRHDRHPLDKARLSTGFIRSVTAATSRLTGDLFVFLRSKKLAQERAVQACRRR
jgi:hypothetical protein